MTREQSIEQLSESLDGQQLAAVLAKGYSDISLAVIAGFYKTDAKYFADTMLSADTVDTLTTAYSEKLIDKNDIIHIMCYSTFRNKNEVDVKRFVQRIKRGMDHQTASLVFVADNYEDGDFDSLADKVESGAYFPTKYGTLSISYEVAKALVGLKVPLRASRKGHITGGILDVDEHIRYGDCIRGGNYKLVQTVKQCMDKPDWDGFYKYLVSRNIEEISADNISSCYDKYRSAPKRAKRR